MNKYKVGDKVLVVKAQQHVTSMENFVGSIGTISVVDGEIYCLEELPHFAWLEEWLEPIEKELKISENDLMNCFEVNK